MARRLLRPLVRLFQSTFARNTLAILLVAAAIGFLASGGDDETAIAKPLTEFGFTIPKAPPQSSTRANPLANTESGVVQASFETGEPQQIAGREALERVVGVLESGLDYLKEVPNYTAKFFRQERVDGQLLDGQVVYLKIRHKPFGVYMRWLEPYKGREALYVDEKYDEKLIVKLDGWRGRLVPVVRLDPFQGRAMRETRHPITEVGLRALTSTLFADRSRDLQNPAVVNCEFLDGQSCNGRDCYYFRMEYDSRDASGLYRKSECYIDKENSLPICIRNFTWPVEESAARSGLDEATLIEFYSYTELDFGCRLSDAHFDESNSEYAFNR